jgi:hypothetical protein
MNISASEFKFVKEGLLKDMALILVNERKMSMEEALNLLYTSDLYQKLSDERTGLISQSARYLLELMDREFQCNH